MFSKVSKSLLIILSIFLHLGNGFTQDIPIGTWRDHLPYADAISVTQGNNIIYCATNSAVFTFNKTDNSIERLNLVNGLSDINPNKIKFNPYNSKVIIAYKNGNIDVLDANKKITNIPFILSSSITGSKTINHIFLKNQFAYLSTDFGIVVLNTDKLEITDTYFYGPSGIEMKTNHVTMDTQNIYAASSQGIYFASLTSNNLADFNNWSLLTDLGSVNYSSIVFFSNLLIASSNSSASLGDSIYFNLNGVWQLVTSVGDDIENIDVLSSNRLVVNKLSATEIFDENLALLQQLYTYNGSIPIVSNEVVLDNENILWFADNFKGLVKFSTNNSPSFIAPDGPSTSSSFALDMIGDDLWMVSGGYAQQINQNNLNHRKNGSWTNFPTFINNPLGGVLAGLVKVAINPKNTSQVFVGSWSAGLIEFNENNLVRVYNARSSPLDSVFFGPTQVGTVNFDAQGNLWVSSSFPNNNKALHVKTPDNNWYSYQFTGTTNSNSFFTNAIIDKNGYKWIVNPNEGSIVVFDDNKTLDNTSDDRIIKLGGTANIGEIPGSTILSIAEDKDGEIWIGTEEGVAVFFSTGGVFDGEITANQIFIEQDGNVEILLGTEVVTVIKIDGANRKWFGTQNSGVFLMDENGRKEISHFTKENSPLFSNNILDITINDITGEVFFATDRGLVSYKGTATNPEDDYNIFIYPNPVKPNFNGTIAIRGLVEKSNVKITDINGNIVYETTSLGGQAIWDGKTIEGKKVTSGVYMVFVNSEDGSQKKTGKILFLN